MEQNFEKSVDVHSLVTNRIIELLNTGTIPWRQSWTESGMPRNLISKRPYRGINMLLLNSLNFPHNLFLTWKQIKTVGGSVIKGEKGHIVVFNKMLEKKDSDKGEKVFFLRYYKVFNIDQCKELPVEFMPKETDAHAPILLCDEVVENMENKPKIVFKEKEAYYQPKGDFSICPRLNPLILLRITMGYYFMN